MNGPYLGQGDELPRRPVAWVDPLAIDPAGRLGVAQDFQVVLESLGADGSALFEQCGDLTQHQRVAFQCGRVVRFQMPDVFPNLLRLTRARQPAEPVQLFDGGGETPVESLSARAAPTCHRPACWRG